MWFRSWTSWSRGGLETSHLGLEGWTSRLGLESLGKWNVSVSSRSWGCNVLVSSRFCDLLSCGHPCVYVDRELMSVTYWLLLIYDFSWTTIVNMLGQWFFQDLSCIFYHSTGTFWNDDDVMFTVAFMQYYDNIGGSIPTWLINWAAKVTHVKSENFVNLENHQYKVCLNFDIYCYVVWFFEWPK